MGRVGIGTIAAVSILLAAAATALVFALVPVVAVAGAVGILVLCLPSAVVVWRARAQRRATRVVWPDVVDHLVSAVRSGLALPDSVVTLAHSGPPITRAAFADFERDYRMTGGFADSLDRLKDRLADPVADRIIETLRMSREVGGNELTTVLRNLAASNQHFQLLFDSTFEGVLIHEAGRIVQVNDALVRTLGFTRDEMVGRDLLQGRPRLPAPLTGPVAALDVAATRRWIEQRRHRTRNRFHRDVAINPRNRSHQRSRIGMGGIIEQRAHRRAFHHLTGMHHHDAVADFGDDAEIVGDEQDSGSGSGAEFAQQVENPGGDRDVKTRGRLVGEQ